MWHGMIGEASSMASLVSIISTVGIASLELKCGIETNLIRLSYQCTYIQAISFT